jgi:quinol monooxygenase YgiN
MLLIAGTIRLPSERVSDARFAMKRMVESSRAEDGCNEYCYAEDLFDPGLIHVKEVWRDPLALERHFASDHLAQWRATWPDLGIQDRNLWVYEVGEPRRA